MNREVEKMRNKRGQVQGAVYQLIFLAIGLVVVGTIVSFGANYMQDTQTDILNDVRAASCGQNSSGGSGGTILYTACPASYNSTISTLEAMKDTAEGQGTVTTVGILAVVIGLLLGVVALFGFLRGREGQ
jgi:hypothetical protein